jgi:aldehyde dehydrogenase (NAD+)
VSARIDDLTAVMVEEYGGVVQFARPIVETGINAFVAAEKGLDELPLTRTWGKTTVTLEPVGVAGLAIASQFSTRATWLPSGPRPMWSKVRMKPHVS